MTGFGHKERKKRGVRTHTDVLYSSYGFAFARGGKSGEEIGLVPYYNNITRPDILRVPTGVLIYNTDSGCLELSDHRPGIIPHWKLGCSFSGTDTVIGLPSDGTYADGYIALTENTTIADAFDILNETLVSCCTGSGGPLTYASHLGTTDGTTNGFLDDPNFVVGRVASPTSSGVPFYAGGWDNDTNRDLTNSNLLLWELDGGEIITDLQTGTISGVFSSPSGVLSVEVLTLDGTVNNQISSPLGLLEVNNLANHSGNPAVIEGRLKINIPTNTLLGSLTSGKLDVYVAHNNGSNTYDQDIEFFKDSAGAPSIADQGVSIASAVVKYLSGVKFLTSIGSSRSSLEIVVSGLDIWSDSYRADPLLINSSNFGIPNFTVSYNSTDVTKNGFSPPVAPFIYNEDFVFSGIREITNTVVNPDSSGNFSSMSVQVRDPFNIVNGSTFQGSPPFLINSYSSVSTDLYEGFMDEDYRLLPISGSLPGPSISGSGRGTRAWDSTVSLVSISGLQVVNGALIFPQHDWSVYSPIVNPDYTPIPGFGNSEVYIRQFRSTLSRTNGVIRIDGLTESDRAAGNILVDIRVVGVHQNGNPIQGPGNLGTGWLSLNQPFNFGSFAGDDGDGCFILTGGYSAPDFEFTLGTFSTGLAENNAIEVRITYPNTPIGKSYRIYGLTLSNW